MSFNTTVHDDTYSLTTTITEGDVVNVNKWFCDECKIAWFSNYDEACEHEEKCKLARMNSGIVQSPTTIITKENNDYDLCHKNENSDDKRKLNKIKIEEIEEEVNDVKTWRCDICKAVSFPNYEEAFQHELNCHGIQVNENNSEQSLIQINDSSYSDAQSDRPLALQDSEPNRLRKDKCKRISALMDSNNDFLDSGSENSVEYISKSRSKRKTCISIESSENSNNNSESSIQSGQGQRRPIRKSKPATMLLPPPSPDVKKRKTKGKQPNSEIKLSSIFLTRKTTKPKEVASIFVSGIKPDKKLIEEQHLVQFQAKRLLQAQQERERQQKRQKNFMEQKALKERQEKHKETNPQQLRDSSSVFESCNIRPLHHTSKASSKSVSHPKTLGQIAPRFPIPSHFMPAQMEEHFSSNILHHKAVKQQKVWLTKDQLLNARKSQSNHSWSRIGQHADSHENGIEEDSGTSNINVHMLPDDSSIQTTSLRFRSNDCYILIQTAMLSILIPPKLRMVIDVDNLNAPTKSLPWVEKYCPIKNLNTDILGESLQLASIDLKAFIEQWMIERQKANTRMADRHSQLQATQNKSKTDKLKKMIKRKKVSYKNDDELLWDDDDDSDAEDMTLRSLFVLTGPVGSGKTGLVQAVTNSLGCKLLEINTSHQRGAVGLKKMLLETTQSLSSMDMLKNRKKQEAKFFQPKEVELTNTDSETEDVNDKATLTVILIDEVDIIFEEDGDNGFWPTLSELCKKSKCPIILTANTYPKQLDSLRFLYFDVKCPAPIECVPKLRKILHNEKFTFRNNVNEEHISKRLTEIVQLAGCDIRRLVLQLETLVNFNHVQDKQSTSLCNIESRLMPDPDISNVQPQILCVEPRGILSNVHSLITIKGSNFLNLVTTVGESKSGYVVSVFVGDILCPEARIVDDSTILAVCSPLILPSSFDETGHYKGTRRRSLDIAYAAITVRSYSKEKCRGILSTSSSGLFVNKQADGSSIISPVHIVNLEYHFPGYIRASSNETKANDSDEFEFVDENPPTDCLPSDAPTVKPVPTALHNNVDNQVVSKLLNDAVDKWCNKNGAVAIIVDKSLTEDSNFRDIDDIASYCSRASDAVLFEEFGLEGIPYLSGSCKGFGFEYTEECHKRASENSKPPSEDRLYSTGWKENDFFYGTPETFVTYPVTARERQLLKQNVKMSRGLAFPRAEVRDLSEEDDDEDHINFDRSEEDLFISNEAPACLISLSVDLMQTNSSLDLPPIDPIRNQLFDTKRDIYAFNRFDLFRNYVFPHDISLCRLFLNQYELDYEPLLESTSIFSSMIFLDYLPILRGIAINECIGEFVHKTISLTEDSELFNNNDRRIGTRRSRKRGRIHHLEKIIPDYIFKKPYDKTPQDIATKLSESSLIYTKSKNEVDRTNTNEITSKD